MLINGKMKTIEDFSKIGQLITQHELSNGFKNETQYNLLKCKNLSKDQKIDLINVFNFHFVNLLFDNNDFYKDYFECIINICRYDTVKLNCKTIAIEDSYDRIYEILIGE